MAQLNNLKYKNSPPSSKVSFDLEILCSNIEELLRSNGIEPPMKLVNPFVIDVL